MKKKRTALTKIYLVNVEDPDDYYFKPEAVLFLDENGYFTLYTTDSRHNFLRAAVQKYPYQELEDGVHHRNHHLQLHDITLQLGEEYDLLVDEMFAMLHTIYNWSPRQHFYLEKHLSVSSLQNGFIP
ncbi:hypothetical protein [Tumebacillus lipolyticus]|uniref:Uncharacterized protein n=1 Tax=Tumebacillus lipolyticus TaxID=1280370 RepID=A0ABW4ZT35_9BACL